MKARLNKKEVCFEVKMDQNLVVTKCLFLMKH